MLLVCDHKSQLVVNHFFLDQGVGADDDVRFMGGDLLVDSPLFLCRHGAGNKNDFLFYSISFKKLCNRLKMLLGKNFRGRHQSALESVAGGL